MDFETGDDRESCRHIGIVSNEVVGIQRTIQQMDVEESELRSMLESLLLRKKNLAEGTNRLEAMVREAAEAVVKDGEQIREMQDEFEAGKERLENQVQQMEERILAAEGQIRELEEKLARSAEELKKQGFEKARFLKIRDGVIRELKAATDSMTLLAGGIAPESESQLITLGESQEDRSEDRRKELKEMEERMTAEIKKLKANVRDRELAIQAKNVEIEMIKESMDAKIKGLEQDLCERNEKKATRLVSFLSEIGSKRTA